MFLNNLRNRLQPHAIPVLKIEENDTTPTEINDVVQTSPDHCGQDTKPDMCNLVPTCSLTNLAGFNECAENDSHVSKHDKAVQAQLEIVDCCSSKITSLKRKCDAAVKRAKRAKIRSNKEKTQKDMTLDELHDLMSQFYPKTMVDFLRNQAANLKKHKNGNRYTQEFKMLCLTLYIKGPKAYRVLRNTFILPSKRTLEKMIQSLIISPGLDDIVFEFLKMKTANLKDLDRYCCISIDTMSLKPSLLYLINRDAVIGYHDTDLNKSFLPACNVAVIMVIGLTNTFKQPLAYFFLHSAMDAGELEQIINNVRRVPLGYRNPACLGILAQPQPRTKRRAQPWRRSRRREKRVYEAARGKPGHSPFGAPTQAVTCQLVLQIIGGLPSTTQRTDSRYSPGAPGYSGLPTLRIDYRRSVVETKENSPLLHGRRSAVKETAHPLPRRDRDTAALSTGCRIPGAPGSTNLATCTPHGRRSAVKGTGRHR